MSEKRVACDGLTIFLNEKDETVKLASCPNEAVYGYGVAFRNYCQECSPGKADQ